MLMLLAFKRDSDIKWEPVLIKTTNDEVFYLLKIHFSRVSPSGVMQTGE